MSFCIFHKACKIVIRCAGGNSKCGVAVVLHGSDKGKVIDRVNVTVAGDVLDVQCAGRQGEGCAVGFC